LLGEGIRFAVRSGAIAAQALVQGNLAVYTRMVQREIGADHLWARQGARVLYSLPRLSWQWGIRYPRLREAMLGVLREQRSYKGFVWRLPLYLVASWVRHPFFAVKMGKPCEGQVPS
jgi:flavin-dependent dehydrogenase